MQTDSDIKIFIFKKPAGPPLAVILSRLAASRVAAPFWHSTVCQPHISVV